MDTRLILVLVLVPAAVCAAPAPDRATTPDPPGLTFRLPLPKPAPTPPKPLLVLPPRLKERVKALPTLLVQPTAPKPPMRLLVLRDDDRKATRTFHPLLTPDIRVEVLPAQPPKRNR